MSEPYIIQDVTDWPQIAWEQMGTKRKFWCQHPDGHRCLFKFSRSHAGEDWSEKIAAEVAGLLGLPHAEIEMATCQGGRGTISRDFTSNRTLGSLVHGNELLLEADPNYPSDGRNFRVAQHTLDRILSVLAQPFIGLPPGFTPEINIVTATDVFIGYLLLDALIANTDRHHANWGILLRPSQGGIRQAGLAPTFDHASSMGRELTDARRKEKLRPLRRDQTIIGYLESDAGRSRIFAREEDRKPLRPLEVFERAWSLRPAPAEAWLERLHGVDWNPLADAVDRVPSITMTQFAKDFARQLIQLNREALLKRSFRYA